MSKTIIFHKNFKKNFKRRISQKGLRNKAKDRISLFIEDRSNPILKNHSLVGNKIGLSAFSITGDIRIVYRETEDLIILIDIGTHNQVY